MIEAVGISLVDNVPAVLKVLRAIRPNFQISNPWMAQTFLQQNAAETHSAFRKALQGIELKRERHVEFEKY
jgi:D-ribose pyranose/furanose isomerase RbsD